VKILLAVDGSKGSLNAAGLAYRTRILVGPVAETLVRHAVDKRCDLILIGSRGMTEVGKALLGSTAAKVLHLSSLPVLLVK
jgi:nucleotide-binding universal stress UspA family protein